MLAALVPLLVSLGHLLSNAPHSIDFAVMFATLAAVLVLVTETLGGQVSCIAVAPFTALVVVGVGVNCVGNWVFAD
jgi:hypothetical protein